MVTVRNGPQRVLAFLFLALALCLGLITCGGSDATPQVIVVTATFTPSSQAQVATATFTSAPEPAETQPAGPTATLEPPPVLEPTVTLALPQPAAPTATETSMPPTEVPEAAATATTAPKPQASLKSYGVIYSNFDGGSESDENKYSVWVMRGDGSEATEVLRPAIEPAFSPNGKKVAFYRPFNGIWIYDLAQETSNHIVASDYAEFASFSPDGGRLVFHEWVGNWYSADVNLYIVNADGSGRTQLPPGIRPAWSPKGGLIAFDTCRGTSCGIYVVQPNGQGFRQVTSDGGGKVSWSPDGKKLVYSTETDGDPEIWMVNLDGSGRKQLTQNNGNDTLPVYSPDGQYIFFLSDQNGKAWAIRVMRPDGSGVKTVRQIGVPPRWQFSRLWAGWW